MALTFIGNDTVVNFDAIASVKFSNINGGMSANVRFLGAAITDDGCSSEIFSGEAANRLREMLIGDGDQSAGQDMPKVPWTPPSRPEFGRTKAWYHLSDADGRRYFMAYVNAKGSCSMRTFDADTGAFLSRKYRPGNYQTQFADFTRNATELTVSSQPNLERDCKERLPEALLAYLKRQVK